MERPLRVLVLSQYFWPEPIPKPLELSEALREEGHRVEIVTGFPNYPEGKLYPETKGGLLRAESVDGFRVIRTYVHPDHGTSLTGRLLNYASFMFSGIIGGLMASRYDVMYVWHPPLSVGVTAAVISFLRRRPFVYDVQDIWPESAIASGFLRPGRITRWMSVLEGAVYRRAAHLLVVTPGAKENLIGKGVPADKITVVPHWFDDVHLRSAAATAGDELRAREGWSERFVVMFAGNLGMMQGLDTIIRACATLPRESRILVVFVGDGSDRSRLIQLASELQVTDRVRFVERQPPSAIGGYLAAADALLVHLRASSIGPLIIPSKTIAYFAAERPIIMANIGASADLVRESGAGIVVAPDSPPQLADAMMEMASIPETRRLEMARRGRRVYEENFTREVTLPKYLKMLKTVANSQ